MLCYSQLSKSLRVIAKWTFERADTLVCFISGYGFCCVFVLHAQSQASSSYETVHLLLYFKHLMQKKLKVCICKVYFPLLHRRKRNCQVLVILQDLPSSSPRRCRMTSECIYIRVLFSEFSVQVKPKSVLSTFAEWQK